MSALKIGVLSLGFYFAFSTNLAFSQAGTIDQKIEYIFGEPLGSSYRILSIPDFAVSKIRSLPEGDTPEDRKERSVLKIFAKGYVTSQYASDLGRRRLSETEWKAISDSAFSFSRASFHTNPDGSRISNLDFENFLVQYEKTTSFFAANRGFSKWAIEKREAAGRSGEKNYAFNSVAAYFTEKLKVDCGKTIPEKAENLRDALGFAKIFQERQPALQQDLRLNPELFVSLPLDFVEAARAKGISLVDPKTLELSSEAQRAFAIYLKLLEVSMEDSYLASGPDGLSVVENSSSSRESKYSQLAGSVKSDLLSASFELSRQKFSAEQALSAYIEFIALKKRELRAGTAQDPFEGSAYDYFVQSVLAKRGSTLANASEAEAANFKQTTHVKTLSP